MPKDFLETINQFHEDCAFHFIDDDEFDPDALINMDETSIYIDKPSNYSFCEIQFKGITAKNNLHAALRTIISTQESMVDYIAHASGEFDSFNPDSLDIFEENDIEIFVDENNNQDETYILDESDLDEESDSNSSQVCLSSEEDDEQLDKN